MLDIDINEVLQNPAYAKILEDPNKLAQFVANFRKEGHTVSGLPDDQIKKLSFIGGYAEPGEVSPGIPKQQMPVTKSVVPDLVDEATALGGDAISGAIAGASTVGRVPGMMVPSALGGAGLSMLKGRVARAGMDAALRAAGKEPENTASSWQNVANLVPGGAIAQGLARGAASLGDSFGVRTDSEGKPTGQLFDKGAGKEALLNMGVAAIPPALAGGMRGFINKAQQYGVAQEDLVKFFKSKFGPAADSLFADQVGELAEAKRQYKIPSKSAEADLELLRNQNAVKTAAEEELLNAKKIQVLIDKKGSPRRAEILLNRNKDLRQLAEGKLEDQIAFVNDLKDRTGWDPRNLKDSEWTAAEKLAQKDPKVFYDSIVDNIFKPEKYKELVETGAKGFHEDIDNVARLGGLKRDDVRAGVRQAFVSKVLEDVDNVAGQVKNPDTLRYRLKAVGPDVVNQIFSNSTDPRREAGGVYETLIRLTNLASRESKVRKMRVAFADDGVKFLGLANPPLGKDAAVDLGNRVAETGAMGVAGELLGGGGMGTKTAATAAGLELLEFSWKRLIEAASKKNSKLAGAIRILSDEDAKYSSAAIQNAYETLSAYADRKRDLKKDMNKPIKIAVAP